MGGWWWWESRTSGDDSSRTLHMGQRDELRWRDRHERWEVRAFEDTSESSSLDWPMGAWTSQDARAERAVSWPGAEAGAPDAWTSPGTTALWEQFFFSHEGVELQCHLRLPPKLTSRNNAVPLLFFLHSASGQPIGDLFPEGDAWFDDSVREPVVVLCPKCPEHFYWLIRGNSWTEEGGKWFIDSRGFAFWTGKAAHELDRALVALLRQVVQTLPVDPCRIFLTGVSMGGYGCLDLAARHPDLFCAVAPVSAHTDKKLTAWAARQLVRTPQWCFHGVGDLCCPFDDMADFVKRLEGAPTALTVYHGGRQGNSVHNSANLVSYVEYGPALLAWMLQQSPNEGARAVIGW